MSEGHELSTLELALVGVVCGWPSSGYDLLKVFEETPLCHFSASPGAIYPALRRLEEAGLLDGEVEEQDTLRPRKVYRITDQGQRALRKHIRRPVTREDVVWRLDELMLRFVFIGNLCAGETGLRFLRELAEQTEGYAEELQGQLAAQQEQAMLQSRLALEHGIEQYRATAGWARRAIEELSAAEDQP